MVSRLPLWRQMIPKWPPFFKDDPQRQMILPLFWMKMIKPENKVPPDTVHFQIHPQMSKADVKQYLEKLYGVDVAQVRTEVRRGLKVSAINFETRQRHEDEKFAYVQLLDEKFEFPELALDKRKKELKELEETMKEKKDKEKKANYTNMPEWFL